MKACLCTTMLSNTPWQHNFLLSGGPWESLQLFNSVDVAPWEESSSQENQGVWNYNHRGEKAFHTFINVRAAAAALTPVDAVTALSQGGGHAAETSQWKEWLALNQQVTHRLWVVSSRRHTRPTSSQFTRQLVDVCLATFPRGLYFTATTEVLWMDFMTAARRLHRSWAWLTCTLGGSLRITVSAEPSRTLGRNSPSFTCKVSGKRRGRSAQVDFSPNCWRLIEMIVSSLCINTWYQHVQCYSGAVTRRSKDVVD